MLVSIEVHALTPGAHNPGRFVTDSPTPYFLSWSRATCPDGHKILVVVGHSSEGTRAGVANHPEAVVSMWRLGTVYVTSCGTALTNGELCDREVQLRSGGPMWHRSSSANFGPCPGCGVEAYCSPAGDGPDLLETWRRSQPLEVHDPGMTRLGDDGLIDWAPHTYPPPTVSVASVRIDMVLTPVVVVNTDCGVAIASSPQRPGLGFFALTPCCGSKAQGRVDGSGEMLIICGACETEVHNLHGRYAKTLGQLAEMIDGLAGYCRVPQECVDFVVTQTERAGWAPG